jgi:hypothetical protein
MNVWIFVITIIPHVKLNEVLSLKQIFTHLNKNLKISPSMQFEVYTLYTVYSPMQKFSLAGKAILSKDEMSQ